MEAPMPFTSLEEDEVQFFSEQPTLDDRIIGIVIPSLIDRRLNRAIQACWYDTAKDDLLSELFRDGGALGSFQTRVQVGFAIGLLDEDIFADLKLIVKIRNAFAHRPGARDFDTQPICDWTRNLRLLDRYPKDEPPAYDASSRKQLIEYLMHQSGLIDLVPLRHRFLRTTEIVLTWLSIKLEHFDLPPP